MRHPKWVILIGFSAILFLGLTSCSGSKSASSPGSPSVSRGTLHEQFIDKPSLTPEQKKLIAEALEWVGTPYSYGNSSKGKGTDCSGFVMEVYNTALSLKLPRNSGRQMEFCRTLKAKEVCPGDLVFFNTGGSRGKVNHVGIMLDSESFIHASSSKGVIVNTLSTPYYRRTFHSFGRFPGLNW